MSKQIIERLERIDHLIRTKATGTPGQLAGRLGISRSSLYEYIELLRIRGATIHYCRKRNCFYYEEEGRFHFNFIKKTEVVNNRNASF